MSKSTVDVAMDRISVATEESQLAVFMHPEPGMVESVFADTITTRALLVDGDFIGSFHKEMDKQEVKAKLIKAAGNKSWEMM